MPDEKKSEVTLGDLNVAADEAKSEIEPNENADGGKNDSKTDRKAGSDLGNDSHNPEGSVEQESNQPSEVERRIAAEKELQAVKSNLGRKIAALESKFDNMSTPAVEPVVTAGEDDDFEIPTTRAEFVQAFNEARAKETLEASQSQQRYEKTYLDTVNNMTVDDVVLHQEVYEEMMKNFNVKTSADGSVDAQLNYSKAEAAVLKRKMSGKTPLDKNTSGGYVNETSPNKMVTKKKTPNYTLTAEEREFASALGMNEDQIQGALETPLGPGQTKR